MGCESGDAVPLSLSLPPSTRSLTVHQAHECARVRVVADGIVTLAGVGEDDQHSDEDVAEEAAAAEATSTGDGPVVRFVKLRKE